MSTNDNQRRGDVAEDHTIVRSEERLHVGTALQDAGRVVLRKLVGQRHDTQDVERDVEDVTMERSDAEPGDSGEVITLPDGSVSVPVFEEEIVVQKRLVVKERVLLRKFTTVQRELVETDVRVERVEVYVSDDVAHRLEASDSAASLVRSAPAEEVREAEPEATPEPRRQQSRKRTSASSATASADAEGTDAVAKIQEDEAAAPSPPARANGTRNPRPKKATGEKR